MSAEKRLKKLLDDIENGRPWEWLDAYTRAANELDLMKVTTDREILLRIYTTALNHGQRTYSGEALTRFKIAREEDYFFVVMRECVKGPTFDVARLLDVTRREVAAGRMTESHTLRKLAVAIKQANTLEPAHDIEGEYRSRVYRECFVIGKGLSASRLLAVTSIEVAAGRMSEDHEFRLLANSIHAVVQSYVGALKSRCAGQKQL